MSKGKENQKDLTVDVSQVSVMHNRYTNLQNTMYMYIVRMLVSLQEHMLCLFLQRAMTKKNKLSYQNFKFLAAGS